MNKQEEEVLNEVTRHYEMATEDLDTRRAQFNTADELFRSHIDESGWPYSSLIFVPRIFTAIFEKTSRLIGSKPRGRLVPRENGDVLGSKINNEILSFQWDEASRVDGEPLVIKWSQMDMNARKYGASFALVKWHYERRIKKDSKDGKPIFKSVPYFDGPYFQILNNRDVLANPSYSTIKKWFQYREYLTLSELLGINDAARGEPIYKNLDMLQDKLKEEAKVTDRRDTNYQSRNKSIKGLQDYLGSDLFNKTVEVVTEYRENRWITFAPKHGVILRDIPNPYAHQQIPVVLLKYYPVDDDLYGLSEIEPVEKLQKALNALTSQYIDAINMELYKPLMVDSTRVRMHTLEFGPGKRWITTGDPASAIRPYEMGALSSVQAYRETYKLLVGEMQEALGETSAVTSNLNPMGAGDKTATEIKDLAAQRLARDNFNQIFLAESIKRQMMLWYSMNQQFLFEPGESQKIIRIVGKDAIDYFKEAGLGGYGLTDEAINTITEAESNGIQVDPSEYMQPLYPIKTETGVKPKLKEDGDVAELIIEPEDIAGDYDYIADIESMTPPNNEQLIMAKRAALEMVKDPNIRGLLQMEGRKVKTQELIEDYLESLGFRDAGKYFEDITNSPMMNGQTQQIGQGAGGIPQGMPQGIGNGAIPGMGGGSQALLGGNSPQVLPQPIGV